MRCTRGWRTTSSLLNAVNAIPRTWARIFCTATMPLFCPRARSICVMSPVTTAFEPKPMRVRNIFRSERDTPHLGQDFLHRHHAALLPACQVDLRDVTGHHRLRAEADAREEHFPI